MGCNNDEAERTRKLAMKKISLKDYSTALKLAEKSKRLCSNLECIDHVIDVAKALLAGKTTVGSSKAESNWYEVLQVVETAEYDEIKKQFRKLALSLHPDKNKTIRADEAFKLINEAHSVLSDKDHRHAFDLSLKQSRMTLVEHQEYSNGTLSWQSYIQRGRTCYFQGGFAANCIQCRLEFYFSTNQLKPIVSCPCCRTDHDFSSFISEWNSGHFSSAQPPPPPSDYPQNRRCSYSRSRNGQTQNPYAAYSMGESAYAPETAVNTTEIPSHGNITVEGQCFPDGRQKHPFQTNQPCILTAKCYRCSKEFCFRLVPNLMLPLVACPSCHTTNKFTLCISYIPKSSFPVNRDSSDAQNSSKQFPNPSAGCANGGSAAAPPHQSSHASCPPQNSEIPQSVEQNFEKTSERKKRSHAAASEPKSEPIKKQKQQSHSSEAEEEWEFVRESESEEEENEEIASPQTSSHGQRGRKRGVQESGIEKPLTDSMDTKSKKQKGHRHGGDRLWAWLKLRTHQLFRGWI